MNQSKFGIQNHTQRYSLIGALLGLMFPIVGTLIQIATTNLPFNLSSVGVVQSNPLLWIIDSAPFIIGYVAMLAGRRQDNSHQRETQLIQKEAELKEVQATLEERVAERTLNLEDRTLRLRIAMEIAKDVASSKDFSELLERASQLIQERFGFYHTGLFILDANKEFAVLAASPTEAGRKMMEGGYKLRVGITGIVGQVAATGESRIVLDTKLDAAYHDNPLLPDTRSEMALALRVERNIIGVLDVQSDKPQAFTDVDAPILQLLADQLAIAIERTRLLQETEANLRKLELAYGQTTRESWQSVAENRLINNSGYIFDNVRIQPINAAPELGYKAIQAGTKVSDDSSQRSVAIPIKLRGQSIGAVTVKLKEGYNQTTINTLEQATERLAGSLESARLFEEARLRADREQTISQVTTAISAASRFDAILRTAVEEIGRSLDDSEVSIQILNNDENEGAE